MNDLVCIARFQNAPTAYIARAKLEALGIEATIRDQHFVAANWFYSNAIGGVKLYVRREHAEEATAALASDDSEALAEIPESSLPPAAEERCPRCSAIAGVGALRSQRWRAMSFLVCFPLPFVRRWMRCTACGHEWPEGQERSA